MIVLVHINLFFLLFVRLLHVLIVATQINVLAAVVGADVRLLRIARFDGRAAVIARSRFVVVALPVFVVAVARAQFLLGFFTPFPFHASILEPDFHLSFRQH